ncbi:hemerythrin domain-containing protein [Sphingomonas cavernae]|nr:hemerythrin domain-containing protein [Sphingomonas cavernae]
MSNLTILRAQHDELLRQAGILKGYIGLAAAPDTVELFRVRQSFANALIAHLAEEDWVLYPRLLKNNDPVIVDTAQAFVDEMGGLLDAFRSWSTRWTADSIRREWNEFCVETEGLLSALAIRIERENTQLYPLADRGDAIAA